jgi:hypothetical protein
MGCRRGRRTGAISSTQGDGNQWFFLVLVCFASLSRCYVSFRAVFIECVGKLNFYLEESIVTALCEDNDTFFRTSIDERVLSVRIGI